MKLIALAGLLLFAAAVFAGEDPSPVGDAADRVAAAWMNRDAGAVLETADSVVILILDPGEEEHAYPVEQAVGVLREFFAEVRPVEFRREQVISSSAFMYHAFVRTGKGEGEHTVQLSFSTLGGVLRLSAIRATAYDPGGEEEEPPSDPRAENADRA